MAAYPIECAGTTCWAIGGSGFLMISSGVPAATPVADPAIGASSIVTRGKGLAAIGGVPKGSYRVSEVTTG